MLLSGTLAMAPARPQDGGGRQVDLELVLAVDVSGSMDRDELALQRNGYVEAIRHPEVMTAVRSGLLAQIAVTYMEWAGPSSTRVLVPWRIIDGPEAAAAFADELAEAPIGNMRGTSISSGLSTASLLFEANDIEGMRQVIDISGDGPNNMGPPVAPVRDDVLARGIIINGLPIMLKQRDFGWGFIENLDEYYAECVIGGPGAFTVPVTDREHLVEAIRRKLVLEIADLAGGITFIQSPERSPTFNCQIGERQRMQWYDR